MILTEMDIKQFIDYLSKFHPLSAALKAHLTKVAITEFYTKNQVILSAGQVASRCWFIERGFAMEYTYRNEEKTPYRFWDQGMLMVDVFSFFRQLPSDGYIEIVESSTVLSITYEQMQYMLGQFREMDIITNAIIQKHHINTEKWALDFLTHTTEERYRQLMETFPVIFQKVSIENIAAYLGVSRKTLSRLRAKRG